MNEELQKALGELLNKANSGIDAASGFLVAELPEVIQQLLMWNGVYYMVLFVIGMLLLISVPFQIKKLLSSLPKKIIKGDKDNWCWRDEHARYSTLEFKAVVTESAWFLSAFVVVAIIVEVAIYLAMINLQWLQIWIAPKVWLLEYAANLTK